MAATDTATVTLSTAKGDIVIKVTGSLAPHATANFVALAACGFYDGVVFHRLVPGFVIQGGDGEFGRVPNVDASQVGTGGPGYTIPPSASVIGLLFRRRPTTVSLRVPLVVVTTVDGQACRTVSHVAVKVCEVVPR